MVPQYYHHIHTYGDTLVTNFWASIGETFLQSKGCSAQNLESIKDLISKVHLWAGLLIKSLKRVGPELFILGHDYVEAVTIWQNRKYVLNACGVCVIFFQPKRRSVSKLAYMN